MKSLILASESFRRRELLQTAGFCFTCASAKIDETLNPDLCLEDAMMDVAKRKAMAVVEKFPNQLIIGADTLVVLGDEILGKPQDEADARRMLHMLSGNVHEVITGVCVLKQDACECFYEKTRVKFRELSEDEIDQYILSHEYYDKAGSYGIQGRGMLFVEGIEGDYFNVVGLPMCRLGVVLKKYIES